MDSEEFTNRLRSSDLFGDLASWDITPVEGGLVSEHAARMRRGARDYFLKEVRENERETLRRVTALGLEHLPRLISPELLQQDILVTLFVPGGPIKSKRLEPGLLGDYAALQNHLNRPEQVDGPLHDDEFFYGGSVLRWGRGARKRLQELHRRENCPIVGQYRRLTEQIGRDIERLAHEYSVMPFAWLHHDFREANILAGPPQIIVDWGSSYGRGPFMFDVAPFCLRYRENLEPFTAHSDICRAARKEDIERWLLVAARVRFLAMLHYLGELPPARSLEQFLQYEWETYSKLADAF
jgi:hypothetical protein